MSDISIPENDSSEPLNYLNLNELDAQTAFVLARLYSGRKSKSIPPTFKVAWNTPVPSNEINPLPALDTSAPELGDAGVYVIQRLDRHLYKIGCSITLATRIASVRNSVKAETIVEHIIHFPRYKGLERALHRRFYSRRVTGEWFSLTAFDLEYIKSLDPEVFLRTPAPDIPFYDGWHSDTAPDAPPERNEQS